jgi:hypothetical protein
MDDYLVVLKHEFEAGDQSFLLKIRVWLDWDRTAFTQLITAMHTYCLKHAGAKLVERWLAEGFWYIPIFTRDWTSHPNFPRIHGEAYYTEAYQQLDALAFWFFVGTSPYEDNYVFEPLK